MVSVSRWAQVFDPVVAATGRIAAVAYFGHDALQTDAAGVLEHRRAVDFEAFAELDGGFGD
jgi:hypothetical protein